MARLSAGGLSDAAYVDVLAYILAANGYRDPRPFARFLNAPLLGVLVIVAVGFGVVSVRWRRKAICRYCSPRMIDEGVR
ncbi:MAG: hypothetical protein F4Y14_19540 [Acidobacteria bacterium]|nr:hypothetical protein [Acidobacteriota bacterium]